MNYLPKHQKIAFVLPVNFWKAEVVFQKLNTSFSRVTIPIKKSAQALLTVSTEGLSKGRWQVCLNWKVGNLNYFNERIIEV